MSISQADAERLMRAGFLPQEVQALAEAKTAKGEDQPPISLDGPAWQDVIEAREKWWMNRLDRGWTEDEIRNELRNYYKRDTSRTPFDFLKAAYKPPKKVDYIEIMRKRHEAQIIGELDGYRP